MLVAVRFGDGKGETTTVIEEDEEEQAFGSIAPPDNGRS